MIHNLEQYGEETGLSAARSSASTNTIAAALVVVSDSAKQRSKNGYQRLSVG